MPRMKRRSLISGALSALALLGGGYLAWRRGFNSTTRRAPALDPAASAPPAAEQASVDLYALTLPDLTDQPQALQRYRGRPLLVNFWATWCAPCVKEMPALDALASRFPGVQFIGIGIDTATNMRDFAAKVPVAYPLLVAGYEGTDILRALGNSAGGLPFTVLFDANGKRVQHILGEVEPDALARVLAGI